MTTAFFLSLAEPRFPQLGLRWPLKHWSTRVALKLLPRLVDPPAPARLPFLVLVVLLVFTGGFVGLG